MGELQSENLNHSNYTSNEEDEDLFVFTDYNQRIVIAFIVCVITIVGTVGNIVVVLAVAMSRKLRSPTYMFITNLAIADLLTCVMLPLHAVGILGRNGLLFPAWMCSGISVIYITCQSASLMTLALIAFTRWYLLTRPKNKFQKLYGKRNTWLMVAIAWLYPLLGAFLPNILGIGRIGYSKRYMSCTYNFDSTIAEVYGQVQGIVFYSPIFTVIALFYSRIYLYVSRHNKELIKMSTFGNKRDNSPNSEMAYSKDLSRTALSSEDSSALETTSSDRRINMNDDENVAAGSAVIAATSDATVENTKAGTVQNVLETSPNKDLSSASQSGGKSQTQFDRHQVNVTKRLIIVVLAFMACFFPTFLCTLIPSKAIDPFRPWAFWFTVFSTCINPIIYARTMPVFRGVMGSVIQCRFRNIPEPIDCIRRRF